MDDGEGRIAEATERALAEWDEPPGAAKPEPEKQKSYVVPVEPENEAAARLFLLVKDTQWNMQAVVAGDRLLTIRHGLKYEVLPALAGGLSPPVALTEAVMGGLRHMEAVALGIFAARIERQSARR